jgi:TPR repeat protein
MALITMSYANDLFVLAYEEFKQMVSDDTDSRWGSALLIAQHGDLTGASRLVSTIIKGTTYRQFDADPLEHEGEAYFNSKLLEFVVATLFSHAVLTNVRNAAVGEMLCDAVDAGYLKCAYNAGNHLHNSAKSASEYKRAAHYYDIALTVAQRPADKAAALISCAPMIAGGLVDSKPDPVRALSLYQQAADLGLVTGMFNAAALSLQLAEKEKDVRLYVMAEKRLKQVVDHVDQGLPLLDSDDPIQVNEMQNHAFLLLGKMHVIGQLASIDHEAGLGFLQRHIPKNENDAYVKNWHIERAIALRIIRVGAPSSRTAGDHWRHVLRAMDWKVGEITSHLNQQYQQFPVYKRDGSSIPFIVLDQMLALGQYNSNAFTAFGLLFSEGVTEYFLATKYALCRGDKDAIKTPILYGKLEETSGNGHFKLISLTCSRSVDDLFG